MRYLLLFFTLLLSTCWVAAQNSYNTEPGQGQINPAYSNPVASGRSSSFATVQGNSGGSGQVGAGSNVAGSEAEGVSVSGCLGGSKGNYTLSAKNGKLYHLVGDSLDRSEIKDHVGHVANVEGTVSVADSSNTIQVISIKSRSKTCDTGGGMSH